MVFSNLAYLRLTILPIKKIITIMKTKLTKADFAADLEKMRQARVENIIEGRKIDWCIENLEKEMKKCKK